MRTDQIVHHVDTPLFLVEEQFDIAAIFGFRADSNNITEGLKYAEKYGEEARYAITHTGHEHNGFWMSSCVGHC